MSLVYYPYTYSNSSKTNTLPPLGNNLYNIYDLPPYLPQLAQRAVTDINNAHSTVNDNSIPINNMDMKQPNIGYSNPLLNEVQNQTNK